MKNNKLIIAVLIGVISAKQIPNINMIGAGIAHNDFVQVVNDTEFAKDYLDYGLHNTNEGKNLQNAFQIWSETQEAKDFFVVAQNSPKSKEGKPIFDELEAAGDIVETHGLLGESDGQHYAYLDNKQFAQVGDHIEKAEHNFNTFKGSDYGKALPYLFEKSFETPEGKQLKRFGGYFVESDAAQASGWHAEHAFNSTVEKGYFFDVPEGLKQELKGAGLNVYKQKQSPVMNMQTKQKDQLLKRISITEQRLKQLEGQQTNAIRMIDPVSLQVAPNRVDIFHKGSDNKLWHNQRDGSKWKGWECLEGELPTEPAVVSWGPNRIDTFHIGLNKALYQKYWDGQRWSDYVNLGGELQGKPTVVSWGPNRIDIFVKGTDNALWHKAWDGSNWTSYESLGGVYTGEPAVVSQGPNHIAIFVQGFDNSLWHKRWDGMQWSNWENLPAFMTTAPAAVSWGPNHIDAFYRGGDNALWHRAWNGSQWTNEEKLPSGMTSAPAVVSWGPDRIDVFYRGGDNALWHRAWNGSQWTDEDCLGGVLTSAPAVSSQRPNQIDVFATGTDKITLHKSFDDGKWSEWENLGGVATSEPAVV